LVAFIGNGVRVIRSLIWVVFYNDNVLSHTDVLSLPSLAVYRVFKRFFALAAMFRITVSRSSRISPHYSTSFHEVLAWFLSMPWFTGGWSMAPAP
jgi:hypothetical protein